jgi:hypothetical protein
MKYARTSFPFIRAATVAAMWLFIVCALAACGRAQQREIFAPVPLELRARLLERLKLLVEYQKTQQWSKQYELLAAEITKVDSKEAFVTNTERAYKQGERMPLSDFAPFRVDYLEGKTYKLWFIFAGSQVVEKDRKVSMLTVVRAYRENDDWFFSPVENVAPAGVGNPCKSAAPTAPAEQKS